MTDNCDSHFPPIYNFSQQVLWALRITNSCIALLNIIGNSFLIYALKKTGQITNMSLELIVLMSASDCISGMTALFLGNIILTKTFHSLCYLRALAQFISHLFPGFSFTTVLLIAIDRFLQIKHPQRYPIVVTKRRGRILLLGLFILHIPLAFVSTMPLLKDYATIGTMVYICLATSIIISVIFIYYKIIKTIKCRILSMHNCVMRSTMSHSKALMNVALRISISTVFFLTIYIIAGIILEVNRRYLTNISKEMAILIWFFYITIYANGVCSFLIFIAQSRPVKRLLKEIVFH